MSANVVAIGLLCQQHLNTLTIILSESLHNIEETIPLCLVESISNQLSGQVSYSDENSRYNQRQWESARRLIADVIPGLKHHEIHHLSVTPSSFHLLCGLTLEEFGRLFESVQDALSVAYPNCPIILGPDDQTSPYGSLRLKLFICLYRLKLATTFREMEAVFGWSDTVLSDWFDVVVHVLHGRLHRFHEGFLLSKGVAWQYEEISAWYRKHHDAGDYQAFLEKIRIANNKQSSVNCPHPIDEQRFTGSLWAVDGTYSVCPSVSNSQLLSRGESLSGSAAFIAVNAFVCHFLSKFSFSITERSNRPDNVGLPRILHSSVRWSRKTSSHSLLSSEKSLSSVETTACSMKVFSSSLSFSSG
jgi:hypothetical protein